MTEVADPRESLRLKLPEPTISTDDPWADDVLKRKEVAERLTNLVRDQSSPFVISVHGHWGTGKTFLLRRWQADLERQGYNAIYFNAWEDDFCDDPLLAILGQLSEYFRTTGLTHIARRVAHAALPLIRNNVAGVLSKQVGVTLQLDPAKPDQRDPLDAYLAQRATKDQLKEHLRTLAAAVQEQTKHPMVFIIDELDRCRPTFAIELLERVKHIFDVPNMVFILGVNRDELCSSLRSTYGEIDADVYLRRFFDMEFTLPEVRSRDFCRHLIDRFELREFFSGPNQRAGHTGDFREFADAFPVLCDRLGLSLRDTDYCVRLTALVGRNLQQHEGMVPLLLALLITLKVKNLALYRAFIQGRCRASDVVNYIDETVSGTRSSDVRERRMNEIESCLYVAEHGDRGGEPPAVAQLRLLHAGKELTHPEYVSERTKKAESQSISELLENTRQRANMVLGHQGVDHLAELIDLHQQITRR